MEVDLKVCRKIGINAGLVYSAVKEAVAERGVPFEGHLYARLSIKELSQKIPLTMRTITRVMQELENKGMVESRIFVGKTKWRRTL